MNLLRVELPLAEWDSNESIKSIAKFRLSGTKNKFKPFIHSLQVLNDIRHARSDIKAVVFFNHLPNRPNFLVTIARLHELEKRALIK